MAEGHPNETPDDEPIRKLVTIGVPLGMVPDPDTGQPVGIVRHGQELIRCGVDAYQILFRATRTGTREELEGWARSADIASPGTVIDGCLEDRLLEDIDFRPDQSDQWSGLRLQSMGMGMGADADGRWRIDVPRRDSAYVDRFTYLLWAASDGRSVRAVSDMLSDEFRDERERTILIAPLSVYRLLSQRAAFLDLVPG